MARKIHLYKSAVTFPGVLNESEAMKQNCFNDLQLQFINHLEMNLWQSTEDVKKNYNFFLNFFTCAVLHSVMMIDAGLYSATHNLPFNDATYYIRKYGKLLKWKDDESVLDIGCGDGDVFFKILLPQVPKNFMEFIGIDINSDMIRIAESKNNNPKVDFAVMDIATPILLPEFEERFDHIFSLYVIHFIPNQQIVFKNMFNMLKPGGEILLSCIVKYCFFDGFEATAETDEWAPYMTDYKKYVGVYGLSENAPQEMEHYLKEQGFICRLCKLENKTFTFTDPEIFENFMCSLNPYVKQIPKNKVKYFIGEFLDKTKNGNSVTIHYGNDNKEKAVECRYTTLIAIASKPL